MPKHPIPSPLQPPNAPARKRQRSDRENFPLATDSQHTPWAPPCKRKKGSTQSTESDSARSPPRQTDLAQAHSEARTYSPRRSDNDKLNDIFQVLQRHRWTLGDLLYYLFQLKDKSTGDKVRRTHQHAAYVAKFLKGACNHGPAAIVDAWFQSPDGVIPESSEDYGLMYSTTVPYTEIKPVRPALSSFAAQTMKKRLLQEAESVVQPMSGLHACTTASAGKKNREWGDIGSTTVEAVTAVIKKHQPLRWDYVIAICLRKPRVQNGVIQVRKNCPVEGVAAHTISSMNFSRNREAQLLPAAHGLYDFAMSVSFDVFAYNSRIGSTVAWSTVTRALQEMSRQESARVRECGQDLTNWGVIVTDNVQNYLLQPNVAMKVGLAATYVELEDIDPKAYDFDDKQRQLTESMRSQLTVEQLYSFTNQNHLDTIMTLQWLFTLARYIPGLDHLKKHTAMLYRTCGAKLQLPDHASKVHPLATCGKNETVTTELKDALLDFLEQTGQAAEEYQRCLKVHQLKKYLQFHDDPFKSSKATEPSLAAWHTAWTDMSRIYESHWDDLLSRDPSSLGNSTTKIGIYLGTEDIFQYFSDLAAQNALPDLEELDIIARKLHRGYSSTRAIHRALSDVTLDSNWAKTVPQGTAWTGIQQSASLDTPKSELFRGDLVLAKEISYLRDTMLSRECALATAEGDVGRVYEAMKSFMQIMPFTFAGLTHTKYVSYLLERITSLELESSPELYDAMLRSMLVNLTGRPGSFCALDFMQEYFNRLLEAILAPLGTPPHCIKTDRKKKLESNSDNDESGSTTSGRDGTDNDGDNSSSPCHKTDSNIASITLSATRDTARYAALSEDYDNLIT
ncbi:hypothetical protein BV22DRAFT_1108446 [Leucogyrophana mollusca]|uniref:Uncharacterized protein n=1 Tax=Leucogyrophana mollusca TaxID=85980 RepID=A0ACB8AX36_9AGAM|nr:hypothetical protein BV22DRAFT_1108446 [Leucogyrophana mollusca]